ncbi:hypothetical protein ACFLVX_01605 [Chloroflexota bacterium]
MKRLSVVFAIVLILAISTATPAFALPGQMWVGSASCGAWESSFTKLPDSLEVPVVIKPEVINIDSKGVYTAFVTFPEDYEYSQDIAGVAGEVVILKFKRQELELGGVESGETVDLLVEGTLIDGTPWWGHDTIIIMKHK